MHSHFRLSPYLFISITIYLQFIVQIVFRLHYANWCIPRLTFLQLKFHQILPTRPSLLFSAAIFPSKASYTSTNFLLTIKNVIQGKLKLSYFGGSPVATGTRSLSLFFVHLDTSTSQPPLHPWTMNVPLRPSYLFPTLKLTRAIRSVLGASVHFSIEQTRICTARNRFIARLRDYNGKCRFASANFPSINTLERSVCNFVKIPHVQYRIEEDISRRFGGWLKPWG